jgi:hypothetical protein
MAIRVSASISMSAISPPRRSECASARRPNWSGSTAARSYSRSRPTTRRSRSGAARTSASSSMSRASISASRRSWAPEQSVVYDVSGRSAAVRLRPGCCSARNESSVAQLGNRLLKFGFRVHHDRPVPSAGSSIGPETSRKQMPFSPACTVTSLRLSNSTNDRLPVRSPTSVYPSSPAFSVRTPSGCDAWLNVPSLYGDKGCASDAKKRSRSDWRIRSSLRHHSRRQRMSEASRFNFRTKRKSVSAEFAPVRRLKSKRGGSHFNQQVRVGFRNHSASLQN